MPRIKAVHVKPKLLNANARMGRHHHRHHHKHFRHQPSPSTSHALKSVSAGAARSTLPRRARGYQTGPSPLLPQWRRAGACSGDGRCEFPFAGGRSSYPRGQWNDGLALGDICKTCGDPAAAGRARGLRGQRREQEHHLYRRPRRRQPAVSQQLPRRNPGVHEDLSQQSRRGARGCHGRAGAAHRRRPAALCQLPALHRRANPTAAIASRASGRCSMSTAGSTASSRTPASPAPARSMRRFRNWKR